MLNFNRKTKSKMDDELVFDNAFYTPIQITMRFETRVAVIRFAVFANKDAALKGAAQIQEPITVRIEGDKFDRLISGLESEDVRGMIENAISRQDDSANKKEKITWAEKKK